MENDDIDGSLGRNGGRDSGSHSYCRCTHDTSDSNDTCDLCLSRDNCEKIIVMIMLTGMI